jgi:hypothetical protein
MSRLSTSTQIWTHDMSRSDKISFRYSVHAIQILVWIRRLEIVTENHRPATEGTALLQRACLDDGYKLMTQNTSDGPPVQIQSIDN